jgi:hypothetical protein
VRLVSSAKGQQFSVDVFDLDQTLVKAGLGVFISEQPYDTNSFYLANVLDGPGTNAHWNIDLKNPNVAPPQLQVTDLNDLVGHYLQIADVDTNIFLRTVIPPLVAKKSNQKFQRHIRMSLGANAPSPYAGGTAKFKLDTARGISVIEVRARNLNSGNSYCQWVSGSTNVVTKACPDSGAFPVVNGTARYKVDTGAGQELYVEALLDGVVRLDQIQGNIVKICDSFGVVHLYCQIPGP